MGCGTSVDVPDGEFGTSGEPREASTLVVVWKGLQWDKTDILTMEHTIIRKGKTHNNMSS